MKSPILLIDLSAIFHPAWRANENGPVSVAFEATLGGVRRCIANAPPWTDGPKCVVGVCCDGRGNWRKDLAPSYKAHREALPNVFYAELDRVKARLRADGLLLWQVDGYEADDLIGTATAQAVALGHAVRIASNDKDMLQLVGGDVDYLSTRTFDILDSHAVREKFGVGPGSVADLLALMGDTSDGVKGAPGVGPKRAAELLNAWIDIPTIYAKLDADPDAIGKPESAIVKGLREGRESVKLARQLVALKTDAPIDFGELFAERTPQPISGGSAMSDAMEDETLISGAPYSGTQDVTETAPETPAPSTEATPALPDKQAATEPAPIQRREKTPEECTEISRPRDVTEVAVVEYRHALEPRSFREALIACRVLFDSRLYQKYKSPEAMAAVVLRGRELGYGAGASLDGFHVISETGALAMHAHMIIDRAMSHPDCEYFYCVETDAEHCVYETKNRRNPVFQRHRYTLEMAKTAKLIKPNGNWEKRPEEQVRKTCGVQLARIVYPGAAMGLYCLEELGEE
jgi:5'-3' exonuclease